ncbi:hypothetical protein Moror_8742 [Moniliophthora roreri MCA 2997]|uniref:Uncharacterized protein n=1 Tax=Moniliophthora roreri (strain MCA 2997) TaxID=1381753 RepID=V2W5Z8_MONRO|nr:hypothetical protein Moror_8742 [Moniliophthora roreri MCA 2997]
MHKVSAEKLAELKRYKEKYKHVIKNYVFEPGTLVQVQNTTIEKSLDWKMKPRYHRPYVVVRRMKGSSYIVAEMDGTVLKEKVATFQVVPHKLRYGPVILPADLQKVLDADTDQPDELEVTMDNDIEDANTYSGPDYVFYGMGSRDRGVRCQGLKETKT